MTERKPAGMSFTSWIDKQISEATERGAFDDLPGAGKPLPRRPEGDDQAWIKDYVRREGISSDVLLPTPLRLRKEIAALAETVQELPSEDEVRRVVSDLNRRIIEWRRIPLGPSIFVPLVDKDDMVSKWRQAQAAQELPAEIRPAPRPVAAQAPARRRWWRRRRP